MPDEVTDVPLQPIPLAFGVGIAQSQNEGELGERFVLVRFSTPIGPLHFMLDGLTASKLAGAIGQHARDVMAYEHATKGPRLIVPGNLPNGEAT